jgi:uncharacterized heparinase superfamily protein
VRWLGWQTYRFIVDLAGQFRTLRRRTEKAGRGFERFRRFLVLLTYLLTYLPTGRAAIGKTATEKSLKRSSNNPEDWLRTNLIL